MTWGIAGAIAGIAGTAFMIAIAISRAITSRLAHIDDCIDKTHQETIANRDAVRAELVEHREKVRVDLTTFQIAARATLDAHLADEESRLGRIERTLAFIAGKLGWPEPGGER